MVDLVEQLREVKDREFAPESLRAMVLWGADEIERLRAIPKCDPFHCTFGNHHWTSTMAENERLRAALQKIVDEAESDDGLTAWDGGDIAKAALSVTRA